MTYAQTQTRTDSDKISLTYRETGILGLDTTIETGRERDRKK